MSGRNKRPKLPPRWAVWTLFLLVLFVPLLLRLASGAPAIPFDDSYGALHDATVIAEQEWHSVLQPYRELLSLFVTMKVPWLLPLLLGLASFALLEQVLPLIMNPVDTSVQRYAMMLAAITPLMQTIFVSYTRLSLFMTVFLLGTWLYAKRNRYAGAGALLCFVALPFIVPAGVIVTILFILHAILRRREFFSIATLITTFVALFLSVPFGWRFSPIVLHPLGYFGEIGGVYGYSIFVFLLGIITIFTDWKRISKLHAVIFVALLVLAAFFPAMRIVAFLPLLLYSANGVIGIISREWSVPFLKNATLLLLGCLALFVILSGVQLLANAAPDPALMSVLEELNQQHERGVLLTTEASDGTASYVTGRQILKPGMDDAAGAIFSAVSMGDAAPWLNRENVRYILVTEGMRTGEIWSRSDEGLLFLLEHNEKFIKLFSADGYELWLFLQEYAQ